LQILGIREDPYPLFLDMFKLALGTTHTSIPVCIPLCAHASHSLQILGIREDPYAFFLDMFKLALGLQLGSAALVFYGSELGLGLDAGDAFRAVGGLTLGYFLRLGIKIEQLVSKGHAVLVESSVRCVWCAPVPALHMCCVGLNPGDVITVQTGLSSTRILWLRAGAGA
jgi:hypothetical protein